MPWKASRTETSYEPALRHHVRYNYCGVESACCAYDKVSTSTPITSQWSHIRAGINVEEACQW